MKKYPFRDKETLNSRIEEILGFFGIRHYRDAKKFLTTLGIDNILKILNY